MIAIIWKAVSPYLTPVLLVVIAGLTCTVVFLGIKNKLQTAKITTLQAQIVQQKTTLDALKSEADRQTKKLAVAEKAASAAAVKTVVRVKYIKESVLPPTATCEEAAAWARNIAITGGNNVIH